MNSKHPKISHNIAHYLRITNELIQEHGYARMVDIARKLDKSKGTVSTVVQGLHQKGLLELDENKFVSLSPLGYEISNNCIGVRDVMAKFLTHFFNIDQKQATKEACEIEHLLGPDTLFGFEQLFNYLKSNDPIAESFKTGFENYFKSCSESYSDASSTSPPQ